MAREEKRFRLRPVDDSEDSEVPVVRLESGKNPHREKLVRLSVPTPEFKESQRLDLPAHEDVGMRTHQPGIEALIEQEIISPELVEHSWGDRNIRHKHVPWGWFVLVGMILAGAVIWSLTGVQESEVGAKKIRIETQSVLGEDAEDEIEASKLVSRIEESTKQYFAATTIDELSRIVRQPERVRPLMEKYYDGKGVIPRQISRTKLLQPLTLDSSGRFWVEAVELVNAPVTNLIIEITENGDPLIDCIKQVCYQPMKWDHFAMQRPSGTSFDFRVYLEADNFFSHEFADSSRWNCFRLTALESDETLFGYTKNGEEISQVLHDLITQNQGRKTSVILRVTIPEGLQSRSGVVIEKIMSSRWIYINPPES